MTTISLFAAETQCLTPAFCAAIGTAKRIWQIALYAKSQQALQLQRDESKMERKA